MHENNLDEHLETIVTQMNKLSVTQTTAIDRQTGRKQLAKSRAEIKKVISAVHLGGAKIDRKQTDVTSETFKSAKVTKLLALGLELVPELSLDHTFLVRDSGKIVGLVTMPYVHQPDFRDNGSNDLVVWNTYDDLSWHFPGQTRLTIVLDKHYAR